MAKIKGTFVAAIFSDFSPKDLGKALLLSFGLTVMVMLLLLPIVLTEGVK